MPKEEQLLSLLPFWTSAAYTLIRFIILCRAYLSFTNNWVKNEKNSMSKDCLSFCRNRRLNNVAAALTFRKQRIS